MAWKFCHHFNHTTNASRLFALVDQKCPLHDRIPETVERIKPGSEYRSAIHLGKETRIAKLGLDRPHTDSELFKEYYIENHSGVHIKSRTRQWRVYNSNGSLRLPAGTYRGKEADSDEKYFSKCDICNGSNIANLGNAGLAIIGGGLWGCHGEGEASCDATRITEEDLHDIDGITLVGDD